MTVDGSGNWGSDRGLAARRGGDLAPRPPRALAARAVPGPTPAVQRPALAPVARGPVARRRAPWIAALVSAGLHAGAALALVAAQVATGAGAAGEAGLDSVSLAGPSAMQVQILTPADLLPDTAPVVDFAAPEAPPAPAAELPPDLSTNPTRAETAPVVPDRPQAMAALAAEPTLAPADLPPPAPKPPKAPEPPKAKAASEPAPKKVATKAKSAEKPAAKAAGSGGGAVAGNGGTAKEAGPSKAEVAELKAAWGARLRAKIEAKRRAPDGGAAGAVKVRFAVAPSGQLLSVEVVASSGQAALDKAAVKAVRAAHLPAAPKGLTGASYGFTLTLRYAP
jgi:protein TonB